MWTNDAAAASASASAPPPAYEAVVSGGAAPAPGPGPASSHRAGAEDPLDLLRGFDTVLVVDDSASMQLAPPAPPGGPTRWQEARDALAGLTALVANKDPDGIDVFFLNTERCVRSCTDPDAVRALFDSVAPQGATPTGTRLEELTADYLDTLDVVRTCQREGTTASSPAAAGVPKPRRRNYIVITDGAPSDDLEEVLVSIAQRLDQTHAPLAQLGFSFIQVGDDPEARAFLSQLDDSLSASAGGKVRDMVDTTPYRGMALSYDAIVKSLLGGINRRFDRLPNHP